MSASSWECDTGPLDHVFDMSGFMYTKPILMCNLN